MLNVGNKEKQFVVEGYVINNGKLLLMNHKKLSMWLPPGGHIEKNELPEEALKREVKEETGYDIEIEQTVNYPEEYNVSFIQNPNHIQVEDIKGEHYHIDLVYLCRVVGGQLNGNLESKEVRFFSLDEINALENVPGEVKYFCNHILTKETKLIDKLTVLQSIIIASDVDFSDTSLLVVQHIKRNTVAFIKLLKSVRFKEIVVIGKPYSVDKTAATELSVLCRLIMPSYEEMESLDVVNKAMTHINGKFICLDLGGYLSRYFDKNGSEIQPIGLIEDTKNGLWFDETAKFSFPLVSIASSELKKLESTFVARSIIRNMENIIINEMQWTTSGFNVLLIGYGTIGETLSRNMKQDCNLCIYDTAKLRLASAKTEGLKIIQTLDNLNEYDLIIGVTGEMPLKTELLRLKNNVILVNGSTRKREFFFESIAHRVKTQVSGNGITTYTLDNNKKIHLLNYGYPVNFFNTESVPEPVMDFLFSEMFVIMQQIKKGLIKNGFHRIENVDFTVEERIAGLWLDKYAQ